jgi:hypothetical protein
MLRNEARVGIGLELTGREELFQALDSVRERIAGLLGGGVSGYNPQAQATAPGAWPTGDPRSQVMPGASFSPAVMQGLPANLFPAAPSGGGFGAAATITIERVDTLQIATVQTLNVYGATTIAGGAGAGGYGGGAVAPTGTGGSSPNLPVPVSPAGGNPFEMGMGGSGLSTFMDFALPGMGTLRGISGMGNLAGAAALGYGAHLAIGAGGAALAPMVNGREYSRQGLAATIADSLSGVPILGPLFGMVSGNLRADEQRLSTALALGAQAGNPFDNRYYSQIGSAANQYGVNTNTFGSALGMFAGLPGMAGNLGVPEAIVGRVSAQLRGASGTGHYSEADLMAAMQPIRGVFGQAWGDPTLAAAMAGNGGMLPGNGVSTLAMLAAMQGDPMALEAMRPAAARLGANVDIDSMIRQAVQSMQLSAGANLAGQSAAQAGIGVSLAQGTLRGANAVAGAMAGQGAALSRSVEAIDAQLAHWQALAAANPNDLNAQLMIAQLQTQRDSTAAQEASIPFQQVDVRYGGLAAVAGAQQIAGGAELGALQALGVLPGDRSRAAFGQMERGLRGGLAAERGRLRQLQALGVTAPDVLEPIRARIAAAEAGLETFPLQEIGFEFGQRGRVVGADLGIAQERMSRATLTDFAGTAEADRAFGAVQRGMQRQLNLQTEQLEAMVSAGAGLAQTEPLRAEIERMRTAIARAPIEYARQVYRDTVVQLAAPGQIAGMQLGAMSATGAMPGAAMEGAFRSQMDSLQAQRAAAQERWQNAPTAQDRLQARMEYERLNAQMQSLPIQQEQTRYGAIQSEIQGSMGIYSGKAGAATARGEGTVATMDLRYGEIAEQDRAIDEQQRHIDKLRAGGAGPAILRQEEANIERMRAQQEQMKAGLGGYQAPVAMRERLSQGEYAANVLQNVPGAYGPSRAILQQQMGLLNEEAADVQKQLKIVRERGGNPEAEHQLNNQLRSIGTQQLGMFNQLSYGWENRLISRMIGAPGNFNVEARGFALADAVGAGVANPHFGATAGQLPHFMRQAMIVPQMGRTPGLVGAMPAEQVGVYGFGNMGGNAQKLELHITIDDANGNKLKEITQITDNTRQFQTMYTQLSRRSKGG